MENIRQDLIDKIAKMQKVFDAESTPAATKDIIKNALKSANNKLAEYDAAQKEVVKAVEVEKTAHKEVTVAKEKAANQKEKAKTPEAKKTIEAKVVSPAIAKARAAVEKTKKAKAKVIPAKQAVVKATKSLKSLVASKPGLAEMYAGTSESELIRDAARKALRPGKRTSASGHTYYEKRHNRVDLTHSKTPYLEKGGDVDNLEKELHKLQRDLNSSRLQTYREGDNSEEEMARQKERATKLARFNEVLRLLNERESNFEKGGQAKSRYSGDKVYFGIYRARYVVVSASKDKPGYYTQNQLWANEYFKTLEQAKKFAKDNQFDVVSDTVVTYDKKTMQETPDGKPIFTPPADIKLEKGGKVDPKDNVTAEKALELMKEGWSIRVRGYDGDNKNFTGIGFEDYEDWDDEDIIETLKEYPQLQFWNEKYEKGGQLSSKKKAEKYVNYYLNDPFNSDMSVIFDCIGMDMPAELEGEEYENIMDEARENAIKHYTKHPEEMTDKYGDPFEFEKGGITDGITYLDINSKNPLSSQLQRLTGDSWNMLDFEMVDPSITGLDTGSPFRHKKSGKVFAVNPATLGMAEGGEVENEVERELLIDENRGIYIPQHFYNTFDFAKFGLKKEDYTDLSSPDNEFYWDAWEELLIEAKTDDGATLEQEGDLWLVPADYNSDDEFEAGGNIPSEKAGGALKPLTYKDGTPVRFGIVDHDGVFKIVKTDTNLVANPNLIFRYTENNNKFDSAEDAYNGLKKVIIGLHKDVPEHNPAPAFYKPASFLNKVGAMFFEKGGNVKGPKISYQKSWGPDGTVYTQSVKIDNETFQKLKDNVASEIALKYPRKGEYVSTSGYETYLTPLKLVNGFSYGNNTQTGSCYLNHTQTRFVNLFLKLDLKDRNTKLVVVKKYEDGGNLPPVTVIGNGEKDMGPEISDTQIVNIAKRFNSPYNGQVLGFVSTWNKGGGEFEGLPVVYFSYLDEFSPGGSYFSIASGVVKPNGDIHMPTDAWEGIFKHEVDALRTAKKIAEDQNYGADFYENGGNIPDIHPRVQDILNGYITAALWSTPNSDTDESFDADYSNSDIAPATLKAMKADVTKFLFENEQALNDSGLDDEQIGHDLWLTRNGHGSRFWDRDIDKSIADQLTAAAKAMTEIDLEVGDDGKVHYFPEPSFANGGKVNAGIARDRKFKSQEDHEKRYQRKTDPRNPHYMAVGGQVDNEFDYMMLSRLQSDCDYYLGYNNRSKRHLWADNVDKHIAEMKRLWNKVKEKPEWLSMEEIEDYEKKMKNEFAKGGNVNSHESAFFTLDDENRYHGYHVPGSYWNGWETPVFDKETSLKILADTNTAFEWRGDKLFADLSWDGVTVSDKEDWEECGPDEINWNGKKIPVYSIGAYSWIWSKANGEILLSESKAKAVKSILVDLAEKDKLPQDFNRIDSSIFVKKAKCTKEEADFVKQQLIKLAIDDDIPMDMNELNEDIFTTNYEMGYAKGGKIKSKNEFYKAACAYLKKYYYLDPVEMDMTDDSHPKADEAFDAGETPEEFVDAYAERYDLEKFSSGPYGLAKGGELKYKDGRPVTDFSVEDDAGTWRIMKAKGINGPQYLRESVTDYWVGKSNQFKTKKEATEALKTMLRKMHSENPGYNPAFQKGGAVSNSISKARAALNKKPKLIDADLSKWVRMDRASNGEVKQSEKKWYFDTLNKLAKKYNVDIEGKNVGVKLGIILNTQKNSKKNVSTSISKARAALNKKKKK